MAFQVERSTFDHLLLQHAASLGAEVREGWTVARSRTDANVAEVEARDESGTTKTFRGKFLIDASGRGNFTGNQQGLREIDPDLKKVAIFGHFAGVKVDAGEKGGDTIIVRLENKWFWIIPLSAEKASIGLVMDREELQRANATAGANDRYQVARLHLFVDKFFQRAAHKVDAFERKSEIVNDQGHRAADTALIGIKRDEHYLQ